MKAIGGKLGLCAATVFFPIDAPLAQNDDAAGGGLALEEVLVTAQKRSTNLQETPAAISAFTGDALATRGIDDATSMQSYVPNLHVGQEQDGFRIALRGVGTQGTSSVNDPGVAFHIDGLYYPRPSSASSLFFDVDRVEVLRGPQGTLYGRNATGGAINVISKRPSSELEAQLGASIGSDEFYEMRGVLNVPLSDSISTRLSVIRSEDEGYHENLSTAPEVSKAFFGSDGDWAARGQVLFDPSDRFELLLSVSYSELNGTGIPMTYLRPFSSPIPPVRALYQLAPAEPPERLETYNDNRSFNDTETLAVAPTMTVSFDGLDVVLVAGQIEQDTHIVQDFDGSNQPVSQFEKVQSNTARSVEVRLVSSGSGPLEWLFGGFYFEEETDIFRGVQLNGVAGPLPVFDLREDSKNSAVAAFGSVSYALTDTFTITAGGRYTEDEKRGSKRTLSNLGQPLPPDVIDQQAKFSDPSWKLGFDWFVADEVMLYASASTGYKSGGFNITSNGTLYEPETVLAYEAGVKSKLLDGRMQLNGTAFFYAYEDMQLNTLTTINNAPGQLTTNAGESEIYGIELESRLQATQALLLFASYSYLSAEFIRYTNSDPVFPQKGLQDLQGRRVPFAPENTASFGAEYTIQLGSGARIIPSINFGWHDELYMREYNESIDEQESATRTDVSVKYTSAGSRFSATAYATNLEDEAELANIYIGAGFLGTPQAAGPPVPTPTAQYKRGRMYGLRLDYSF